MWQTFVKYFVYTTNTFYDRIIFLHSLVCPQIQMQIWYESFIENKIVAVVIVGGGGVVVVYLSAKVEKDVIVLLR